MTKKITLSAMMVALALALSYLEHFIPLQLIIPIPGIKLGLANTATVFVLLTLGRKYAYAVLVARCVLQGLLVGTLPQFLFSLCGGLSAMTIMSILLQKFEKGNVSLLGLSIAAAAAHNIGQVLCAVALYTTVSMIYYLPILLLLSIVTGLLTGSICQLVLERLAHTGLKSLHKLETAENKEVL